jgi:hypothetical protein
MVAKNEIAICKEKWVCGSFYTKSNSVFDNEVIIHYMCFSNIEGTKKVPHCGTFIGKTNLNDSIRLLYFEQIITKPYEISDTYLFSYLFQQV